MENKVSAQAVLINKEYKVQWFYETKVLVNEHLYEAFRLHYEKQKKLIEYLSKNKIVTKSDIEIESFIGSPLFCEVEDLPEVLELALKYLTTDYKKDRFVGVVYREDDDDNNSEAYKKMLKEYLENDSTIQRKTSVEEMVAAMRMKKIITNLDEARGFVHKNPSRVVGLKRDRPDLERAIEVFESEIEQPYKK